MLRTVLLTVHVAAGTAGLVLGPPVLLLLARRQPASSGRRVEAAYLLAVGAVCASAIGLVLNDVSAFWWLGPIAAATGGAAYGAHRLRPLPGATARAWRFRLLGGTYVSLVTALLVVSMEGLMSWLLPSLIGVVMVEYVAAVHARAPSADGSREKVDHAV